MLLAAYLDKPLQAALAEVSPQMDPLSRAFGSAKEAIGDTLFLKADQYYHGGVSREDHHDESREDVEKKGILVEKDQPATTAYHDWVSRINRRVHAQELRHLSQDEKKEMFPFFSLAVTLDPYNVEAVLTTAFWLDKEFKKPAEAEALLEKGIRDNPASWELENELAKLKLREGRAAAAEKHFREAADKAKGQELESFSRAVLYYEWGECLLRLGKKPEALTVYRASLSFLGSKANRGLRKLAQERIKGLSV
jgi:tetratricopeptide (TPR) repeat protein